MHRSFVGVRMMFVSQPTSLLENRRVTPQKQLIVRSSSPLALPTWPRQSN